MALKIMPTFHGQPNGPLISVPKSPEVEQAAKTSQMQRDLDRVFAGKSTITFAEFRSGSHLEYDNAKAMAQLEGLRFNGFVVTSGDPRNPVISRSTPRVMDKKSGPEPPTFHTDMIERDPMEILRERVARLENRLATVEANLTV